jgi:hypothetical protein
MKRTIVVALACLLTLGYAFAGEPTAADQKWLETVSKMVADGQTKVSTPSADRVGLLKEWAGKNGYSIEVTKSDTSYRAELSKNLAQK